MSMREQYEQQEYNRFMREFKAKVLSTYPNVNAKTLEADAKVAFTCDLTGCEIVFDFDEHYELWSCL